MNMRDWRYQLGLTQKEAGEVLGRTIRMIQYDEKNGAPWIVQLAMRAVKILGVKRVLGLKKKLLAKAK